MAKLVPKDKLHTYGTDVPIGDVDPVANASIRIGGEDPTKFIPNINCSKWGGICWLNINAADFSSVTNEIINVSNVVEATFGSIKLRWLIDLEGHLEYEVVFASRPAKTSYRLDLDFPVGLEFYYQAALTEKEVELGFKRPENVVGSYAVYWKQKNNQFKTGKFCHIFYPYVRDASGATMRVDSFVIDPSAKTVTIELPRAWLRNAIYPVTLDPNLGYSTGGASSVSFGTQYALASWDNSDASGGNISEIHSWNSKGGAGDGGVKAAVYTDDVGNNRPEQQVTAEVEIVVPGSSAKADRSAVYSGSLSASTKYWVAEIGSSTAIETYYDGGPANKTHYPAIGSYDLPATWPNSGTNGEYVFSCYAVYAPAGEEQTLSMISSIHNHIAQKLSLLRQALIVIKSILHALTNGEPSLAYNAMLGIKSATLEQAMQPFDVQRAMSLLLLSGIHNHISQSEFKVVVDKLMNLLNAHHGQIGQLSTLSYVGMLSPKSASHDHIADSLSLIVDKWLSLFNVMHGHIVETSPLQGHIHLPVKAVLHNQTIASQFAINLHRTLAILASIHGSTTEHLVLSAKYMMAIKSAIHGQTANNIVSLPLLVRLLIKDAIHGNISESPRLSLNLLLAIRDAIHLAVSEKLMWFGFPGANKVFIATPGFYASLAKRFAYYMEADREAYHRKAIKAYSFESDNERYHHVSRN